MFFTWKGIHPNPRMHQTTDETNLHLQLLWYFSLKGCFLLCLIALFIPARHMGSPGRPTSGKSGCRFGVPGMRVAGAASEGAAAAGAAKEK